MVAHVGQAFLNAPPHVVPHDDLSRIKHTEVSAANPQPQFKLPESEGEGEDEQGPGELTQQQQGLDHQEHQPGRVHSIQSGAAIHTEKKR